MAKKEKTQTYWHGPGNVRIDGEIYKPGSPIPMKNVSDEKREKWLESGQTGEASFPIEGAGEIVSENQRLKNQVNELSGNLVSANAEVQRLKAFEGGSDPEDKAKITELETQAGADKAKITELEEKVANLEKSVEELTAPKTEK